MDVNAVVAMLEDLPVVIDFHLYNVFLNLEDWPQVIFKDFFLCLFIFR